MTEITLQPKPLELLEEKRKELQALAESSTGLTISGVDDKSGFQIVHAQEQKLVKARTAIEKIRKEYTAQFDLRKKEAIELEKELIAIITPAEEALKAEKKRILDEQERIAIEAIRKQKEALNQRVQALAQFNKTIDLYTLEKMTEQEFSETVTLAKLDYEVEQERLKKESDEKAKYEKERAEFEANKAKQEADMKAERDKIEAEKKKLENEKNRIAQDIQKQLEAENKAFKEKEEAEARKKRLQEEELEENKKQAEFAGWLKNNGYREDQKDKFEIRTKDNGDIELWWKLSTLRKN